MEEKNCGLIFGTGNWTTSPDDQDAQLSIIDILKRHGIKKLDTARLYMGGQSETFIGNCSLLADFQVSTKSICGVFPGSGTKESILQSAKQSLNALRTKKVKIYFLHGPDTATTPLAETLDAIQEVYKEGCFELFGLSNFSPEEVLECYNYASSKGYVLPTVYQSNYNLVARKNEKNLFPILRQLGIRIQAYSPIAGGFLAKDVEGIVDGKERWDPSSQIGQLYHALYNKPEYLKALEQYRFIASAAGEQPAGLAYRWIRYHSALGQGDQIILGATKVRQLEETLLELEKGPLPEHILQKLELIWKMVEPYAPVDNFEVSSKQ